MKTLTLGQADYLRGRGYTHIAAVVKSVGYSKYYNVNSINAIMKNGGKWIALDSTPHTFKNGFTGNIKVGTISTKIDWRRTISRRFASYLIKMLWG